MRGVVMKKLFVFAAFALFTLITSQVCAQPGGGKIVDTGSKPATKSTTTKPSTPKPATNTRSTANRGAIASLDGKWWTSGNDFGDSEVVLTQNGTNVTGEIHYSDGR